MDSERDQYYGIINKYYVLSTVYNRNSRSFKNAITLFRLRLERLYTISNHPQLSIVLHNLTKSKKESIKFLEKLERKRHRLSEERIETEIQKKKKILNLFNSEIKCLKFGYKIDKAKEIFIRHFNKLPNGDEESHSFLLIRANGKNVLTLVDFVTYSENPVPKICYFSEMLSKGVVIHGIHKYIISMDYLAEMLTLGLFLGIDIIYQL